MKNNYTLYALPGVIGIYAVVHSIYYGGGLANYTVWEIVGSGSGILIYSYALLLVIPRKSHPVNFLIAALILVMTLFYGSFRDHFFAFPAMGVMVRNYFWNKTNYFFIALSALFSLAAIKVFRSFSERSTMLGRDVIWFFCALICMDMFTYYHDQRTADPSPPENTESIHFTGEKPDVYFIIFDSETSSKSLERYWHYNNDSAEQSLKDRGFTIARDGQSDYNWTPYSIASTLNMAYLGENVPVSPNGQFPQAFGSAVFRIFAQNGYAVHNLSYFRIGEYPQFASIDRQNILERTIFYFLYDRVSNYTYREYSGEHRELFQRTYDSLSSLIENDHTAPKFVYAHFYIPHTPAFLDEHGNATVSGSMEIQDMNGYLAHVKYSYAVMLRLIDKIHQQSKGNAIIVIQGDHGYRFLEGKQKMQEQFDILNAIYFPDRKYAMVNDSLNSVNTFRIILDSQFGAGLALLKDSSSNVINSTLQTLR